MYMYMYMYIYMYIYIYIYVHIYIIKHPLKYQASPNIHFPENFWGATVCVRSGKGVVVTLCMPCALRWVSTWGTANSAGRSTHQQQLRWTVIEVEIQGIQNASLIVGSARVFGKVKTRRLLAQRT